MTTAPDAGDAASKDAPHRAAELTRDELRQTLNEVERRLQPSELAISVQRAFVRRPAIFIGLGVAVVAVVGGVIVWRVGRLSR